MILQSNIKWLLFVHQVKKAIRLEVLLIVHYLLTNWKLLENNCCMK